MSVTLYVYTVHVYIGLCLTAYVHCTYLYCTLYVYTVHVYIGLCSTAYVHCTCLYCTLCSIQSLAAYCSQMLGTYCQVLV